MANTKLDTLVTEMAETGANIKAAQAVQRKRVRAIQGAMELGLLTDEQIAKVSEFLPKERAKRAKAE